MIGPYRSTIFRLALALLLAVLSRSAFAYPWGAEGRGKEGCGLCHLAGPSPTTRVCIEGLPAGNVYAPGQPVNLNVFVDGSGLPPPQLSGRSNIAGFAIEASHGELAAESGMPVWGYDAMRGLTHDGTDLTRNHWDVIWTPPTCTPGSCPCVTLYLSGNAVNGDGGPLGDLWNTVCVTLSPSGQSCSPQVVCPPGVEGIAVSGIACNPPIPLPQRFPVPED